MKRDDNSKFLLYIEPKKSEKLTVPFDDELVHLMEHAFIKAKSDTANYSDLNNNGESFDEEDGYMGVHTTECGKHSDNHDFLLENGMITNSLCAFYLRWYRNSISQSDMLKLQSLKEFYEKSTVN